MNTPARSQGVAVVCDRHSEHAALVEEYLREQGVADAEWYLPRDVDEVDQALRAGQVRHVIFPTLDDFLAALWDEPLTLENWLAPSVSIELARPSGPTDAARAAALIASWRSYRERRRRAQAVAGVLLSAVAVAAAFVVLVLAR
jgi:hypothetical protein